MSIVIAYDLDEGDVFDPKYRKANICNITSIDTRGYPGTIEFCKGVPCVANLFIGNRYAIRDEYMDGHIVINDSKLYREAYFKACLDRLLDDLISVHRDIDTIVFPYEIGCGAAGGNWVKYERLISQFAFELINNKKHFKFIMVYNLNKMKNTDDFYNYYPFINRK
uniref:Wsv206-like protein n=1 Tax=Litopenaeus vannamei majanivirus Nimav-1_LVa TaxID=2984273 RepID=A0A9C7BM52_9VIRU|nr:MAG: wsv206-like protein [Litopenaeus vannamei majanivirus Nimav-1_LVa]